MKAVILAAGVGSRLGKPYPKSLNKLPNGETILGRQIRILRKNGINEIYVVVGFKMGLIMESFPEVFYRYNPVYYVTNTSKSLLCAIRDMNDDVLWTNGDVIFDEEIIAHMVNQAGNAIAVNSSKCGEEEVKYKADNKNQLTAISKQVQDAHGEAVGINKISKEDIENFKSALENCSDNDYFEKGIEMLIDNGKKFNIVNISNFKCIEVDFEEDWKIATELFTQ
ncbi:MAG: phosphocholine cytidylyltransferase family protein [Clostridia bacterium]|nr:phosphocholine cytidylyltransferase family protein [Clostridia bacterium]